MQPLEPGFEPPVDEDEGMYLERTTLAWSRTGIGLLVCVAALGRRVWPLDRADHKIALFTVAVGGLIAAFAMIRAPTRGRRADARAGDGRGTDATTDQHRDVRARRGRVRPRDVPADLNRRG